MMPLHRAEPQEDYAGGHVIDPLRGYVNRVDGFVSRYSGEVCIRDCLFFLDKYEVIEQKNTYSMIH